MVSWFQWLAEALRSVCMENPLIRPARRTNSSARRRYALAPGDFGSNSKMVWPCAGASASRMLVRIYMANTRSSNSCRICCTLSRLARVR